MRAPLAALGVVAFLAGCVTLSQPAPQVRDYRLDYPPPAVASTPIDVAIRVPPLGVAAIYDRQAMVYRDDSYSMGAYVGDRWAAGPGSMIADLLARDLAAAGLYRAVQQGPSILPSDYQLTGQVEEIEEREQSGSCIANLRVRILLVRSRTARGDPAVLRATYADTEPCACDSAAAFAAAMSSALARVSAQLQADVHTAIGADRR